MKPGGVDSSWKQEGVLYAESKCSVLVLFPSAEYDFVDVGCCCFFAPQLLSPYTVALYGGLCALASFDRHELYTKVIGSR